MRKDYYQVLQVPRDAGRKELRKAFHRLAHRWHPDKNPGDAGAEDRFKELNEAYAVLSDPSRRVKYDLFGNDSWRLGASPIDPDAVPFAGPLLRRLGRLAGFRFTSDRDPDVRVRVLATLEESAAGSSTPVSYRKRAVCRTCGGSGDRSGGEPRICAFCSGTGVRPMPFPVEGVERICPGCGGRGLVPARACRACRGVGTVSVPASARVRLPRGAMPGDEVRLAGGGHYERSRGTGDLVATVELKDHPLFRRNGRDLSCELMVPPETARAGGVVELPGLLRNYRLRIPAGARPGLTLRLNGGGLPGPPGDEGHLFVRVALLTAL